MLMTFEEGAFKRGSTEFFVVVWWFGVLIATRPVTCPLSRISMFCEALQFLFVNILHTFFSIKYSNMQVLFIVLARRFYWQRRMRRRGSDIWDFFRMSQRRPQLIFLVSTGMPERIQAL